jgi:hypothetical protein
MARWDWVKKIAAFLIAILLAWTVVWYFTHRKSGGTPQTCGAPTGQAVSGVAVPGVEVSVNGTVLPTPSTTLVHPSNNTLAIKNTSGANLTVSSVELFENVDHKDQNRNALDPACRYIDLGANDCLNAGGPRTLGSGESCSVAILVQNKVLTGFLQVQTTAGQLQVSLSVPP